MTQRHPARGEGRAALIDAAIAILTESGVAGVTYRAVAERAGVTHGLLRYHFHTLAELLRAVVTRWAAASIAVTTLEPGTGRVADIGAGLVDNVREHAGEHLAMYELIMAAARTGALAGEITETYRGFRAAVGRELSRAGFPADDGILASVVFAALDGLVIQQLVEPNETRFTASLAALAAMVDALPR